ncbi:MAG: universal stress protein [Pseudomonadota bacterium]
MAYKSILTVVRGSTVEGSALAGAAALVASEDAHLEVLALGIDAVVMGGYYGGANALIEQESFARASEEAVATEAAVREALAGEEIRWSVSSRIAQSGTISSVVGAHARFADLVVLPKPYGEGKETVDEAILEAALFTGHVSVLVLPDGKAPGDVRRVVAAWNQSAEAMGAIRSALPLLKRADMTDILIIDPPRHGPDRSDPGGPLSQMLARHGVRPEVSVVAGTLPRTADTIARHCTDRDADLLVMGAYGHSRFREALLGGATRDILERAELPVFMHH